MTLSTFFTDITDAVILHAEDDRQLALEFIQNMETELPELELNLKLSEQFDIGNNILESAANLFRTCRFIFVLMTRNIEQDYLSNFVSQMLLIGSIKHEELHDRLIPISKDEYSIPAFIAVIPLPYNRYLEGRSQNKTDHGFIKSFKTLIIHGRQSYLIR